jgi:hypothetical protein
VREVKALLGGLDALIGAMAAARHLAHERQAAQA